MAAGLPALLGAPQLGTGTAMHYREQPSATAARLYCTATTEKHCNHRWLGASQPPRAKMPARLSRCCCCCCCCHPPARLGGFVAAGERHIFIAQLAGQRAAAGAPAQAAAPAALAAAAAAGNDAGQLAAAAGKANNISGGGEGSVSGACVLLISSPGREPQQNRGCHAASA